MPADLTDLERRLAQATSQDTVRGMFFNGTVEVVRDVVGESAARICAERIGHLKILNYFSYPVSSYLPLAWAAVERLERYLGGTEPSFFKLGHAAVTSFLTSTAGSTLIALAGHDPRRMLAAAPVAYLTAVSYGERAVHWLGDRRCRLTFKRDFMVPAYHAGVLTAATEIFGGKRPKAVGKALGLLDSEYDLIWE